MNNSKIYTLLNLNFMINNQNQQQKKNTYEEIS